jgi:hypothetical protein
MGQAGTVPDPPRILEDRALPQIDRDLPDADLGLRPRAVHDQARSLVLPGQVRVYAVEFGEAHRPDHGPAGSLAWYI